MSSCCCEVEGRSSTDKDMDLDLEVEGNEGVGLELSLSELGTVSFDFIALAFARCLPTLLLLPVLNRE